MNYIYEGKGNMTNLEHENVIEELLQGLKQNNVILYVGKGAKASELTPKVCSLDWRCVVTSQTRADFGKEFASDQRKPKRYTRSGELPANLFDRINLPVIQIYGSEGNSDEMIDDIEDSVMTKMLRKKSAEKIMDRIMARLDVRCKMVVIGYDPEDPQEFPMDVFMPLWYDMSGGTLLFFGMKELEWGSFRTIAEKRGFTWCDAPLCELLELAAGDMEDEQNDDVQQVDGKSLFYKGKQPVTINTNILLHCRYFAQLLTEETIYQRRPLGRTQQSIWYYNFLNDSSVAPQWYGYLPQSDFHLKRPFEDILADLVDSVISGKEMYIPGEVTSIILEGDSGSSKSITLAALAYRTFEKKINPVVFIQNEDLFFGSSNNQELNQLDELLHEIELAGSKDVRTLILWDSASYRDVAEQARNLTHHLSNRGRRFVLVCTAYKGASNSKQLGNDELSNENRERRTCWYVHNNGGIFRKQKDKTEEGKVYFDGRNYFVQSDRTITDSEKFELRNKIKEHWNVDQNALKKCLKKLEEEGSNDIFIYFYRLIDLIRPNLEERLSNEQRTVNSYVNKQLEILGIREKNEDESDNIILQAMRKAGIQLTAEDEVVLNEEEEQADQMYYDLDRFNTCIAMFSRFKLDTPYTLGIHMLYKEGSKQEKEFYNNLDLFNLVTNDIPWVYYGENLEGNFIFKFRNSLEAEIFLAKNDIGAERQIDIICEMLDYYAKTYQNQGYEDEILMHAIQRMLRLIGPNTDYQPFSQIGNSEHFRLLRQLNRVISKLTFLREEMRIPDRDASFASIEITFMREFYGKLWDRLNVDWKNEYNCENPWESNSDAYKPESYALRLNMLKKALDLAVMNIDTLEQLKEITEQNLKKHILDQINSLAVEISYCNTSLDELWHGYMEACKCQKEEKKVQWEDIRPLPYLHSYQMLVRAITTAPTNGYAYNALFQLFEKEYARSSVERQLELLSEIRMIADDASTLDITDRGMHGYDTLSVHIQRVKQYSSGFQVTIESILDGSCPPTFVVLFDSMLAKNNASGITFVCQQELDNAGLDGKKLAYEQEKNGGQYVLTQKQLDVCRKILDFMKCDEYAICVDKDAYALYLMLRVAWMYYNKRPMSDGREAQLTYIEASQWDEIRQICEKYQECSGINKRPIVTLIHALSLIQLSGDYMRVNRMMESLNENVFASTARMRVPYMICDQPGVPRVYSGTVLSTKNYGGFIHVDGVPRQLGSKTGVRFFMRNLGMQSMPEEKQILKEIELGLGYTGFSVYTKEGRKSKEGGNE